jgi:hypothetical protein
MDTLHGREAEYIRYGEECAAIARMARTSAERICFCILRKSFVVWRTATMKTRS